MFYDSHLSQNPSILKCSPEGEGNPPPKVRPYKDIDIIATGTNLSPDVVEKNILAIMEASYGETRMEKREVFIVGTTEKRPLTRLLSLNDTVIVDITVGKTLEDAMMRKEYFHCHWFHEII